MIDWNCELTPGLRASYIRRKSWVIGLLMAAFVSTQVLFLYRTFDLLFKHGWAGLVRGALNSQVPTLVPVAGLILSVAGVGMAVHAIQRSFAPGAGHQSVCIVFAFIPINFASKVAYRVLLAEDQPPLTPQPFEHYLRLLMAAGMVAVYVWASPRLNDSPTSQVVP